MVMRPEPWGEALEEVLAAGRAALGEAATPVLVVPAPSGEPFRRPPRASSPAATGSSFACGRYEGIDERVLVDAAPHACRCARSASATTC